KGIQRSNAPRSGAWHSTPDMQDRPEFAGLAVMIVQAATALFADMGYRRDRPPKIDTMWANVTAPGGFNRAHIHPNVLWSGVYYVQAPPDAGRIIFSDPRMQALMMGAEKDPAAPDHQDYWSEVNFAPTEGRILLFPAWLMHATEPNRSNLSGAAGERISVSFNLRQGPPGAPD
ncbi:MAG: TIGR02466 family protein, partial [Minwuia sp.]|nr:TIGR02466 family protein [Minwuia sp.]